MKSFQENTLFRGSDALLASRSSHQARSDNQDIRGSEPPHDTREEAGKLEFEKIVDNICELPWENISSEDILNVALAYYFFSIQFRENLEIACRLFPDDEALKRLHKEECNTDNLSPWEDVAEDGEMLNHDEFMRRLLLLRPVANADALERAGELYLAQIRHIDDKTRAKSIASYEDGGLARVFGAMLRARTWEGAGQLAFKHFLEKHIEFDSPEEGGHGALSRHLMADDSILPLWSAFEHILQCAVSVFANADVRKG